MVGVIGQLRGQSGSDGDEGARGRIGQVWEQCLSLTHARLCGLETAKNHSERGSSLKRLGVVVSQRRGCIGKCAVEQAAALAGHSTADPERQQRDGGSQCPATTF